MEIIMFAQRSQGRMTWTSSAASTHSLQLPGDSQPPGTAPLVVVTPQPSSAQSCCCVLAWMMALLFIASFQRPPTSELPGSSTRASLQLYQQPGCCQQSG